MFVLRNLLSSVSPAVLALVYAVTYGALIFAGPLQSHMSDGVAEALIGGAIACFVLAPTSTIRPLIAGPEGSTVALLAALTGSLTPFLAQLPPDTAARFAMMAIGLTTLVAALSQFLIGRWRFGKLVRFIPFPVVAGFLGSTAWLLVSGAVRMATGAPAGTAVLDVILEPGTSMALSLTVIWAIALNLIGRKIRHPTAVPAALVLMTIIVHVVLGLAHISLETARADGLLFSTGAAQRSLDLPWTGAALAGIPWHDLAGHVSALGDVAATALMSIIAILLNTTGLEVAMSVESDLDRELRFHGLANLVAAPFCGMVSNISVSRTLACRATGGTGRVPGILAGGILLLMVFSGVQLSDYLPRFVVAGLLLQLGVANFWQWGIRSFKSLPFRDWLTVLAIIVLTALFSTLWGLLYGVLACCVILALDVGRIEVLRHAFGLNERPSSRQRSAQEMQVLARDGHKVQVLVLTGFIFFGSAHRLYERVKVILHESRPQAMIFDFDDVDGGDSSAAAGFSKIETLLRETGVEMVLTSLGATSQRFLTEMRRSLPDGNLPGPSLDEALEHWEETLLHVSAMERHGTSPLFEWLSDALGEQNYAGLLAEKLKRREIAADEYICRQGDPTDALLFIESGRVSVLLQDEGKQSLRLRVFGARTILGEVGFFLDRPRTASLRGEEPTVLWALEWADYMFLRASQPDMVAALFTYIVELQSERLAYATRQIAALNR